MRKRKYTSLDGPKPELDGVPLPVVHNIVATSQIVGTVPHLDLERIRQLLPFSFYDKNKFAAITIRLSNPECTTLLFSSGKLVVTGGRTWYESVYSSLYIARLLGECMPGETFRLARCEVQNMVAHVELKVGEGMLDIQAMYGRLGLNCTYQRKMFPGLIFRPEASPVVLLCFYSGKIVITGGKTIADIYEGWNRQWPVVQAYVVPDRRE
jgi:transcription initiation factor TFIID TATA-box-binding protein